MHCAIFGTVLTDLPLFLRVAELGSFTQAADVLGLPRSTLSRRIRALEDALGCRLLERTTRLVRLTPEGRRLAEESRPLVSELQRVVEDVRDQGDAPQGRVRGSVPVGLGRNVITEYLLQLQEELPGVRIEVVVSDGPVNLVRDDLDLALAEDPLPDTDAIARPLIRTEARCMASPAYLEARGTPATPGDLVDHATLYRPRRPGPPRWPLRDGGDVAIQPLLSTTDVAAIVETAIGGLGIALLPNVVARDALEAGELVQVLPEVMEPRTYYAMFAHRDPPRRVQAVLEFSTRFVTGLISP